MARLAIKGHPTRGNEVIEILELLGGINIHNLYGDENYAYYTINSNKEIKGGIYVFDNGDLLNFTLEEFLEKFPYKVGDKVKCWINGYCSTNNIKDMRWDNITNEIKYKIQDYWYSTMNLQPYKEVFDANAQCCDIMNHLIKERTMEEELIPRVDFNKYCKDRYLLDLGDYEIKEENGKTYAVRKQFKYLKTYEECCDVLNIPNDERYVYIDVPLSYNKTLKTFTQLLICRDAYWKIARWEFNYDNECYYLCTEYGKIKKSEGICDYNVIFAFPTAEMRDAFKENFDDDIDVCKEFL